MTDSLIPTFDPGAAFGPPAGSTTPSPGVVSPTDWDGMSWARFTAALGEAWGGFRRRTLPLEWDIGRGLTRAKKQYIGDDYRAYLKSIDINPRTARRLIQLAGGFPDLDKLSKHASRDAALKSLDKRSLPPAPVPSLTPSPDDPPVSDAVLMTADGMEQAVAEVAAEVQPDPVPIPEDTPDRRRRDAQRHRDDVAAVNTSNREKNAAKRGKRDVGEAILTAPACACGSGAVHVEDLLVEFYGWARKATP